MPLPDKTIELSTDHWSFQKVQRPEIPQTEKDWGSQQLINLFYRN